MRRLSIVHAILAIAVVTVAFAQGASAQEPADDPGVVDVFEVSGYIDPILVEFIDDAIAQAEQGDSMTVILQLNSPGSVVSDADLNALAERVTSAEVPVAIWIGPSGSEALGSSAQLWAAVPKAYRGIASGSDVGRTGVQVLDTDTFGPLFGEAAGAVRTGTINADQAAEAGLVAQATPTLGDFLVDLPGFQSTVESDGTQVRRVPETVTRFAKLPLGQRLLHTVASPPVAYLLLLIGMSLILFEFYTAGVGVAGVTGGVCFILACYGLWVLPTNAIGIALLVLSILAFAVDVQTGVPRFWSAVAVVFLVAGSFLLYDGPAIGWLPLLVGIGGMLIAMLSGMPAMVRTRFSTPTIGREWMVGESATAIVAVDPDGTVRLRDALWPARTNRATPIPAGDEVLVAAIDGPILEVEPLEGAARDYRDRGAKTSAGDEESEAESTD